MRHRVPLCGLAVLLVSCSSSSSNGDDPTAGRRVDPPMPMQDEARFEEPVPDSEYFANSLCNDLPSQYPVGSPRVAPEARGCLEACDDVECMRDCEGGEHYLQCFGQTEAFCAWPACAETYAVADCCMFVQCGSSPVDLESASECHACRDELDAWWGCAQAQGCTHAALEGCLAPLAEPTGPYAQCALETPSGPNFDQYDDCFDYESVLCGWYTQCAHLTAAFDCCLADCTEPPCAQCTSEFYAESDCLPDYCIDVAMANCDIGGR